MKLRHWVAVVLSMSCVMAAQPFAAGVRAQVAAPGQPGLAPLTISGSVLAADGITRVPNAQVRLRNLDTGAVVGETRSDANGTFSFTVPAGMYVVEVGNQDGKPIVVGPPLTVTSGSIAANIVLPAAAGGSRAATWLIISAVAGALGVVAWTAGGDGGGVSPEQ